MTTGVPLDRAEVERINALLGVTPAELDALRRGEVPGPVRARARRAPLIRLMGALALGTGAGWLLTTTRFIDDPIGVLAFIAAACGYVVLVLVSIVQIVRGKAAAATTQRIIGSVRALEPKFSTVMLGDRSLRASFLSDLAPFLDRPAAVFVLSHAPREIVAWDTPDAPRSAPDGP
jgi:hypothetical protein